MASRPEMAINSFVIFIEITGTQGIQKPVSLNAAKDLPDSTISVQKERLNPKEPRYEIANQTRLQT